jgi:hypothetical protein
LRMLYAGIFEEGASNRMSGAGQYGPAPMATPQFGAQVQNMALPPPPAQPPAGWRSRPITAELANRPSVTENTTRLLDKGDQPDR